MKIALILFATSCVAIHSFGQSRADKVINAIEVSRIETVLSSDSMEGRKVFSPGLDKAADFIAAEFRKSGIQPAGNKGYFQQFEMLQLKPTSTSASINGQPIDSNSVAVISSQPELHASSSAAYDVVRVRSADSLFSQFMAMIGTDKHYLLLLDTSLRRPFQRMKRFASSTMSFNATLVCFLTNETISDWKVDFTQEIERRPLQNVVGILPGKSRKNEYVIFSGHYDHLGIGKANAAGDSIYNGANDDAAGTTAVIMLAKYFAAMKDNARTLIFVAFTGEESGGFGSRYFSQHMNPDSVVAMFNIEMIGTESKWGKNSAYITGFDYTNMGTILQQNLEKTNFKFYPDPYPQQQLFFRSDNATLALQGVPAHTISTSKMDAEKYYHTQDDEINTLDMTNMAEIIRAIALSSRSIISGKDTPTRVDRSKLK